MKRLFVAMELTLNSLKNNKGDIGIKQIALTIGAIVIIGSAVSIITGGKLATWIDDVWDFAWGKIQEMTN